MFTGDFLNISVLCCDVGRGQLRYFKSFVLAYGKALKLYCFLNSFLCLRPVLHLSLHCQLSPGICHWVFLLPPVISFSNLLVKLNCRLRNYANLWIVYFILLISSWFCLIFWTFLEYLIRIVGLKKFYSYRVLEVLIEYVTLKSFQNIILFPMILQYR